MYPGCHEILNVASEYLLYLKTHWSELAFSHQYRRVPHTIDLKYSPSQKK